MSEKYWTGIFVGILFLRFFAKGYFKGLGATLKTFSFRTWLLWMSAIPVLAFVFFFADAALLNYFQASKGTPAANAVADFGGHISDNTYFWIALGLVFFVMDFARQEKLTKLVFSLVLASGLTGLVGHVFKFIFLRARPYDESGPFSFLNWDGILSNAHASQSLPSGDVAIIAGAASCLFFSIRHKALRWIVLFLPLATAYARVMANRHWPSDGLVSILLGLFIARLVWGLHKVSF